MLNKASVNDDGDSPRQLQPQQPFIIVGDIVLHNELKVTIVQVVTQILPSTSASPYEKPMIHRLSANPTRTNNSQAAVPCDLKNTTPVTTTSERPRSSTKLIRMQKAGVALVKELKSKVVNGNHPESKTINENPDTDPKQAHF
ncbi:unnamed protein product [Adineta ricciae]|uniref:Uncharacterized protein n=1 Tax=Adineta ricciae TaxID=249248 RepID=A0A814UFT7_ADIRI|nr:unnamed protein product [Adineta ricciae]CAF1175156.1 unnamed protein product [Adineta ricciae]